MPKKSRIDEVRTLFLDEGLKSAEIVERTGLSRPQVSKYLERIQVEQALKVHLSKGPELDATIEKRKKLSVEEREWLLEKVKKIIEREPPKTTCKTFRHDLSRCKRT